MVAVTSINVGANVTVDDTPSINLTKLGSGTTGDPIVISGVVVTGAEVTSVPTTGGTTNIDAATNLQYFDHAATIATHTVNLPVTTTSFLKEVTIISRSIITALTVAAPGAAVAGMPTTLAANAFLRVRLVGTTWRRVG